MVDKEIRKLRRKIKKKRKKKVLIKGMEFSEAGRLKLIKQLGTRGRVTVLPRPEERKVDLLRPDRTVISGEQPNFIKKRMFGGRQNGKV